MGADLPTVFLGEGRTAVEISCGNDFSCAVLDSGEVKCWGEGKWAFISPPPRCSALSPLRPVSRFFPLITLV